MNVAPMSAERQDELTLDILQAITTTAPPETSRERMGVAPGWRIVSAPLCTQGADQDAAGSGEPLCVLPDTKRFCGEELSSE